MMTKKKLANDALHPALFWDYYHDMRHINGKVANRKLLRELKRRLEILS